MELKTQMKDDNKVKCDVCNQIVNHIDSSTCQVCKIHICRTCKECHKEECIHKKNKCDQCGWTLKCEDVRRCSICSRKICICCEICQKKTCKKTRDDNPVYNRNIYVMDKSRLTF